MIIDQILKTCRTKYQIRQRVNVHMKQAQTLVRYSLHDLLFLFNITVYRRL